MKILLRSFILLAAATLFLGCACAPKSAPSCCGTCTATAKAPTCTCVKCCVAKP